MDRFRIRSTSRLDISATDTDETPIFPSLHPAGELATPSAAQQRDDKRFAGFFGRWSNRSSPVLTSPEKTAASALDAAVKRSLVLVKDQHLPTYSTSPRRARHIPIVISGYTSPYDPIQQHTASLNTVHSFSTSSSSLQLADAIHLFPSPPESPTKEVDSSHSTATMNHSQLSLSASESGLDSSSSSIHLSNSSSNLASITTNQQSAGAANVSGLVCNVHRTTGKEPPPLVGATTTILGDRLYVFGGRIHSKSQPNLSAQLYELDLIRRHWTRLETTGAVPPPRYFHSVCALGDTKLVCYGGMSPASYVQPSANATNDPQAEVVVMSDIHVYDVISREWKQISPSRAGSPEGRYAHCASITPSSAVWATSEAYKSALHHNPSSSDPHSGTLEVQIDGSGGAEMVVVGGQDAGNNYIQQISVFNLRSLKWTTHTPYDRNCGAYKSMVTALPGINGAAIGKDVSLAAGTDKAGTSMLIYSNYNFLDVRLELQVRHPDSSIEEKVMAGPISPPGLRFPNGGIINDHFVVSGTFLTSSKHEYALWALNLKTLTWAMIDTTGTVSGQGSWNRGVLWNRRNTYVILGHRKRSLVDDYNHRRVNFAHLCLVELEAYGLYDNPRKNSPNSAYVSNSAPALPLSLQQSLPSRTAGGRLISDTARELGESVLNLPDFCDMQIIALHGERIPCNSNLLARRWGPYFSQLMLDATNSSETSQQNNAAALRPNMNSRASRISALTITPNTNGLDSTLDARNQSRSTNRTLVDPGSNNSSASSRLRNLYLPHTGPTIRLMLCFLYTSSLPPLTDPMCSPHALCSLLHMARPYQIDGLQEATIERLHEALDGRNAASVFNAAAMAAGGGRATGMGGLGTLEVLERRESAATTIAEIERNTNIFNSDTGTRRGHRRNGSGDSTSTATSTTTSTNLSESQSALDGSLHSTRIWTGELSSVIGLQKRGLRGLMEGRRLRERETQSY